MPIETEFDTAPIREKITSQKYQRRENIKAIKCRLRKGQCAKAAYSHKQALTQRNTITRKSNAQQLFIYKCPKCSFWHLTHKQPWPKEK